MPRRSIPQLLDLRVALIVRGEHRHEYTILP
nr:MAG TPA: hypothetical protein [Caudoviricetes sp.]